VNKVLQKLISHINQYILRNLKSVTTVLIKIQDSCDIVMFWLVSTCQHFGLWQISFISVKLNVADEINLPVVYYLRTGTEGLAVAQ